MCALPSERRFGARRPAEKACVPGFGSCRSSGAERVGPEGSEQVGRDGEGVRLAPAPVSSVQTLEASELADEEHGRCAH